MMNGSGVHSRAQLRLPHNQLFVFLRAEAEEGRDGGRGVLTKDEEARMGVGHGHTTWPLENL